MQINLYTVCAFHNTNMLCTTTANETQPNNTWIIKMSHNMLWTVNRKAAWNSEENECKPEESPFAVEYHCKLHPDTSKPTHTVHIMPSKQSWDTKTFNIHSQYYPCEPFMFFHQPPLSYLYLISITTFNTSKSALLTTTLQCQYSLWLASHYKNQFTYIKIIQKACKVQINVDCSPLQLHFFNSAA